MSLTGKQKEFLDEALRDAYRTPIKLKRMLAYRCQRDLEGITTASGLQGQVFELIEEADAAGWVNELIAGALEDQPLNAKLRELYDQAWFIGALRLPQRDLESIVSRNHKFVDVDGWLSAAQSMAARVCRVEIGARARGTGFLVGPETVMTNHHVVESAIRSPDARVVCRFDYRILPDGTTAEGIEHKLRSDGRPWLVADSSPSSSELSPRLGDGPLPTEDELDMTVLALDGHPGDSRGWITASVPTPELETGSSLAILQHPDTLPLKLALDTRAVIAVNRNGTRVTYRTNTLPGSSGSPCFTFDWEVVAIHHMGDPLSPPELATRNEGIPISAILKYLKRRGMQGVLETR